MAQKISQMTEQTTASMTETGESDFLGGYTATGGNANRKFSLSGLANYFLNKFKLTLGGSSQTVKSAIDSLNSKTALTMTRTENTNVTEQNFNRMYAFKRGNMLFLNGNLAISYGDGFTEFTIIGTISNWSAVTDVYVNVPSQNDGSKIISVQVIANGTIRIYSSTEFSGAPFFRFFACVPCA